MTEYQHLTVIQKIIKNKNNKIFKKIYQIIEIKEYLKELKQKIADK